MARIRKSGYPIRKDFTLFSQRYKCLLENSADFRDPLLSKEIAKSTIIESIRFGTSKVFLKEADVFSYFVDHFLFPSDLF